MRFAREDPALSQLLCGVVQRQAYSVILNPYANAFNYNNSEWSTCCCGGRSLETIRGSMCSIRRRVIVRACLVIQAGTATRMTSPGPT